MIYITGDLHGNPDNLIDFHKKIKLTETDVVVVLGDVGANYYGPESKRDNLFKKVVKNIPATIFCVHGNHEMRPHTISSYITKEWNGGTVWYEPKYPNLLFAKDGDIFNLDGKKCMVIGGAYSVDKYYRLGRGFGWWADEQPSEEIKQYVENQLQNNKIDYIFSHTCPYKYEPREMFLAMIDQSTVDDSTEKWLDKIEESTDYAAWYCGHWHTDKRIDKMHFLFNSFENFDTK